MLFSINYRVIIYDTTTFTEIYSTTVTNNCVHSVTFHPYSSLLIASSGQRTFHLNHTIDENNDDNDDVKFDEEDSSHWSELMMLKYKPYQSIPDVEI